MATRTRSVRFEFEGDISDVRKELKKLPGATDAVVDEMIEALQQDVKLTGIRAELEKLPGVSKSAARRMAGELEKGADDARRAWSGVGDLITAELATGIIEDSARSLIDYQKELQQTRVDTIKFAQATGISLDTLGGIELAVKRTGGDFDQVRDSLADFGEVMFDVANGAGRAKEAFDLLDIETRDLEKGGLRPVDDVLREVLDKLPRVADDSKRVAIAQQLASDSGLDLAAALQSQDLQGYIDDAKELGIVIDDEIVQSTKNWTAANRVAEEGLLDLRNSADFLPSMGDTMLVLATTFDFWKNVAVGAVSEVADGIGGLGQALVGLATRDFAAVQEGAARAFQGPQRIIDVFDEAAAKTAKRLADVRAQVAQTGIETKGLEDLEENREKAAKAAAAARKTRETEAIKRLKEEQDLIRRQLDAEVKLHAAQIAARDDLLDAEDKIQRAFSDRLVIIREVESKTGETARTQAALADAEARRIRDLARLRQETLDASVEAERQAAAAISEIRQDQFNRTLARAAEVSNALGILHGTVAGLGAALSGPAIRAAEESVAMSQEAIAAIDAEIADAIANQDADKVASLQKQQRAEEERARRAAALVTASFHQGQEAERSAATIGAAVNAIRLVPAFAFAGPLAPVLAGAVAAGQLATQLAIINNQQAPTATFDHGGIIGATGPSPDQVTVTGQTGESFLNRDATEGLGQDGVDRLNATGGRGAMSVTVNVLLDRRVVQRVVRDMIGDLVSVPLGGGGARIQLFNGG